MNRITIELWLWMGNKLEGDFETPSRMRSVREEQVEEGTTIRQLLQHLAGRYPAIAEKIFDIENDRTYPYIVVTYNDQVISPYIVHDIVLRDGDKITILPMYTGG